MWSEFRRRHRNGACLAHALSRRDGVVGRDRVGVRHCKSRAWNPSFSVRPRGTDEPLERFLARVDYMEALEKRYQELVLREFSGLTDDETVELREIREMCDVTLSLSAWEEQ